VSKRILLAIAAPISIAGMITSAQAQNVAAPPPVRPNPVFNPDGSVTTVVPPFETQAGVYGRPRPDFDPLGVRLGSFMLFPSLTAGGVYNSNVFYTQNNTQSDIAFEVAPTLVLNSDLPRHALSFLVGSRSLFYKELDSENTTEVTVQGRGRLDVQTMTNIVIDGGYSVLHEARGAPDLPGNAAEPTEYSAGTVQGSLNHTFNRLQLSVGASLQKLDYNNTPLLAPATVRDNSDRNHDMTTVFGEARYEFSPGYLGFVRGSYNERNYDLTLPTTATNFARNSQGNEVVGGVQFEVTRLLVGQAYAGYLSQDYEDTRFGMVSGGAYGGQLEWYPTELTTVRANVRHSVEETTILGASSYTISHFGIGADHELLRNVILTADAIYDDYEYNGISRNDHFWGFSVGAMYLMNRNVQLNLGYILGQRDSNVANLDYTNNSLRFGVVGKI
jgi:hypothetical protein